ncbi:PREDICTED: GDP-D-glucose phosphorylase 1 [Rhagoletis zephyria]|uniref:GDP-D-glucose phosphorylase 1 n=1 Tax=Rhagoletis zephyria TaxID=28612 RepID=UPI0008118BD7|nr:PREDICTED: GDP-D-glucose phosphorylase 1 [Rhagoletis zephyria]XP_017461379.1 PREDICTED: GDP-D-glucose phosphorylase 1 [Rhagoletis zephyria]
MFFKLSATDGATFYLNDLKQKWLKLHITPDVFAYNLNVTKSKFLRVNNGIYVEYNPERTRLRRIPQTIEKLRPVFDEEQFNFKKINSLELLISIPYEGSKISLIINKSPLTVFHTLICPDVAAGLPQCLTPLALKFCITFLLSLRDEEKSFRIGYNSPGALASVNHLHLHLLYITTDLYIDKAEMKILKGGNIFRLSENMPTEAICFLFKKWNGSELTMQLQELYNFIIWLCDHNIPHNLFMTRHRSPLKDETLKVFVFTRKYFCYIKELNTYNIGFCEMAGYVTVGDLHLYENLTERQVISKIQDVTGNVYKPIYEYFEN